MSFDVLTYAKDIDIEDENGQVTRYPGATVHRVLVYTMKYSPDTWYRQRAWNEKFLLSQFPRMVEAFPRGWKIPGPPMAYVSPLSCPQCHGKGMFMAWSDNPIYRLDPRNPLDQKKLLRGEQSLQGQHADCNCVRKVTVEEAARLEKSREYRIVPEPFLPLEDPPK